ncbi:MAG: hypothetical protein GF320_10310 [Armatimonadia bacterium]|nr:hypothetical protein [Armatimonadia bacterium]
MPSSDLECSRTEGGSLLALKVLPRASRDELVGVRDGRLCVRTTAPPVDGSANSRVVAYLAKALGFRKSSLSIDSGEKSREKTLAIHGADPAQVRAAVDAALKE